MNVVNVLCVNLPGRDKIAAIHRINVNALTQNALEIHVNLSTYLYSGIK